MMNINMQNEVDIYSRRNYTMNVGSLACQKKEVNHMSGQIHIKGSLHVEDGTYIVRARVPDPVTGKVRQRSKSTKLKEKGNNKRKAEQAMREILAEWEAEANRIPVATFPYTSRNISIDRRQPCERTRWNPTEDMQKNTFSRH